MKDNMKCISCGCYFRHHSFNRTNECDDCLDSLISSDTELELEIELLKNRSGKKQPFIPDERELDIDSFGS